jgi:hypothetical protein
MSDSIDNKLKDFKINDNLFDSNEWRQQRRHKLGFDPQKEIIYNNYLPYSQYLSEECVEYLSLIKANIGRTLILNDRHGFAWISDLSKYSLFSSHSIYHSFINYFLLLIQFMVKS